MHQFADSRGSSLALEQVKSPGLEKDDIVPIVGSWTALTLQNSLVGWSPRLSLDFRLYSDCNTRVTQVRTGGPNPGTFVYESIIYYPLTFPPVTPTTVIVRQDAGFEFRPSGPGAVEILSDQDLFLERKITWTQAAGTIVNVDNVRTVIQGASIFVDEMFGFWAAASVDELPAPLPADGNTITQFRYWDAANWIQTINQLGGNIVVDQWQWEPSCNAGKSEFRNPSDTGLLIPDAAATWQFTIRKFRVKFIRQGRAKLFSYENVADHIDRLNPLFPVEGGCQIAVVAPVEVLVSDLLAGSELNATYFPLGDYPSAQARIVHRVRTLSTPPFTGVRSTEGPGQAQNYFQNGLPFFNSSCS